jgi:hypothetical protein
MTAIPMSQPRPADPIHRMDRAHRRCVDRSGMPDTGPAPAAGELGILAGRLAMALRMHSGRRSSIDPASLVAPIRVPHRSCAVHGLPPRRNAGSP